MTATASIMVSLGTSAPDFNLPDVVTGRSITLETFANKKALLVMFISRHCPYVMHVREELARIGQDYRQQSLGIVAICANDTTQYPEDSKEKLAQLARDLRFNFPLCQDEEQETAKAYQAVCTPDFFLFDEERRLVYRGQLDDSRPGNSVPITGKHLRAAIDATLNDIAVNPRQKASLGCNIKWKPGSEPRYFRTLSHT